MATGPVSLGSDVWPCSLADACIITPVATPGLSARTVATSASVSSDWSCHRTPYTPAIDIWSIGCIFAEVLTRNPLFPGTNVTHQLDLITDVLGTPSHETLSQICNEKARRYLTGMKRKHPIPFPRMFCNADPQAVRLLERLLAFDPKDRPTAEEALADPYFEGLPKLEHEPSPYPFSKLDFEFERWKLSKDGIRDLIYREILEYHPQMLQDYIRGGGQTSFVYPRERSRAPMGSDNQDCNNENRRTASSAGQIIIRPQQVGMTHAYVYQNGTGIPDFCSGYYLQNGGTSDSSCAIGENEGPKEKSVSEEEKVAYELSELLAKI
ncbi:Mitogen-activated protein kinase 13 [Hordeum vulgare]|nr:Mitogen-activated protein kinase 13 [Hordeum vulgare]